MKKILIIEDDPVIAHVYRTLLQNETYAVETCSDGQSGFNRLLQFNTDAILLDLMLPGMNGLEFLKKVRAHGKFASIPVVVFTNAFLPNTVEEATSAGASQVYNKATLTPKQLLDCLYFLINGKMPCRPETAPVQLFTAKRPKLSEHPGSPPPPANYGYYHDDRKGTSSAPGSLDTSFFDSECYKSFVAAKPEILAELRAISQEFIKASDSSVRDQHLLELYRKVHSLTARAGLAKFVDVAQICSALEVLLKELHEHPKHINVSTLRTVVQTVEFMWELFEVCEPGCGNLPAPKILVVDDEVLSRRAIVHALERGNLKSTGVEDPMAALKMACDEPFDLFVLDIQMPALNGFDLCSQIRALPINQDTPVLFVTSLSDFKNRAKATMMGGTEFIAKPFFFVEVAIKATTLILRERHLPKAKRSARGCSAK